MGSSTFSGPIKAGSERADNVGFVKMVQSANVTQTATTTGIIIPAGSHIISVSLWVTVVWNGAASTMGLGYDDDADALTAATAIEGNALGLVSVSPTASAAVAGRWIDVGTTDRTLILTSGNTGTGVGVLTVEYAQAMDLT